MMMKKISILVLVLVSVACCYAQTTSVAGFYCLPDCGRIVYNFNQGWRYHLGDVKNAEAADFDDSGWEVVCAPHSARLEPSECSGGKNYQGICWYRKHFVVPTDMKGKMVTVHFEAIMGKQKVYVNGKLAQEHLGGYLPIEVCLNDYGVKAGDECLIAVMADNSDDKNYPPGKKQSQLDFCYHGGMYRDVWLIGKNEVSIDEVFMHYDNFKSAKDGEIEKVTVNLDSWIGKTKTITKTKTPQSVRYTLEVIIKDANGGVVKMITKTVQTFKVQGSRSKVQGQSQQSAVSVASTLNKPHLWSPEDPYLYNVELRLKQGKRCIDGGMVRIGIRKAEFKGKEGFWLNGKPYHKLIGGNRHQDFAYVGNAMPNSQQWRDAKRLKDAGMCIVRAAHYPQDPAFMDACDELGLFVIVPTPGWQFWNKDPKFAELVHQNTRDIIHRDRNHPCVLMWEPILNETNFPKDFSEKAHQVTIDEYPYPNRPVAAADMKSAGVKENYEIMYGWPEDVDKSTTPADKCVFTREFGEYVDDWYAHNAINRAPRFWGEKSMLDASLSLDKTYKEMLPDKKQFIGGCQWHPFDHQRGYHPDPYFGGIYDAFRQPKYQLATFKANSLMSDEPYLFIAHEMMQFSGEDVVVFTNCDSVRLTAFEGDKVQTISGSPAIFKGFWNFWDARRYSYSKRNWQKVSLVAEGFKDGKVVCTEKKMPARRSTKLRLYADTLGKDLVADGSDFIVVVAEVTDDNGNVRRLAKESVLFTVEGEGEIIGGAEIGANPRTVEWGSAPVLIRSTTTAGEIKVIARSQFEGIHAPTADTLVIRSKTPSEHFYYEQYDENDMLRYDNDNENENRTTIKPLNRTTATNIDRKKLLEEVEKQQQDFGTEK